MNEKLKQIALILGWQYTEAPEPDWCDIWYHKDVKGSYNEPPTIELVKQIIMLEKK